MLTGRLKTGPSALLTSPIVRWSNRAAPTFMSKLRRASSMVWMWIMRNESRRQLSMLSDHILRDIGLTRADVGGEFMRSSWLIGPLTINHQPFVFQKLMPLYRSGE